MIDLNIREAAADDLGALTDIYNYYVLNTHVTFDLATANVESRRSWFDQFNGNSRHRLFVGETDGQIVGYASSSRFRTKPAYAQSVETTIYISQDATGNGYGHSLYGHLLDALAGADVHRCYGVIALPNDASVSLHERLGFSKTGILTEVGYKFGKYWDTLWMERRV